MHAGDGHGVHVEIELVEEEAVTLEGLRQVGQRQVADVALHLASALPHGFLPQCSSNTEAVGHIQVRVFVWKKLVMGSIS